MDSICPTGFGKVAGVKVEIHGERRAGAGPRLLGLLQGRADDDLALTLASPTWNVASPLGKGSWWGPRDAGINGIAREKAEITQRGRAATQDFEQEQTEKTERRNFAKNALFVDIARQREK